MKPPDIKLPTLPNAPPPPPVFAQSPQGQKPKRQSPTASFLNAPAAASGSPSGSMGLKALTGQ